MAKTPTGSIKVIDRLYRLIEGRREADPETSYVARLFARGRRKIAQKVGEEAVETVIAACDGKRSEVVQESADLIFHLLVMWARLGVRPEDVFAELERREGTSGLAAEKAKRIYD